MKLTRFVLLDYAWFVSSILLFMVLAQPVLQSALGDTYDEIVLANDQLRNSYENNEPFAPLDIQDQLGFMALSLALWAGITFILAFFVDLSKYVLSRKHSARFYVSWLMRLALAIVLVFGLAQVSTILLVLGFTSNTILLVLVLVVISLWFLGDFWFTGWSVGIYLKRVWVYGFALFTLLCTGFIPYFWPVTVALLIGLHNASRLRVLVDNA